MAMLKWLSVFVVCIVVFRVDCQNQDFQYGTDMADLGGVVMASRANSGELGMGAVGVMAGMGDGMGMGDGFGNMGMGMGYSNMGNNWGNGMGYNNGMAARMGLNGMGSMGAFRNGMGFRGMNQWSKK